MQILGIGVLAVTAAGLAARLILQRRLSPRAWSIAVGVLSLAVLAVWQPLAVGVTAALLAITLLVDAGAAKLGPARSTPLVWLGTALLVAPLVFYKYLPADTVPFATIVPLGLSFTVFRLIGVLWDHRNLRIQTPWSHVAAMTLFYPTLPAGPITTVSTFKPWEGPDAGVVFGVRRLLLGLGRKLVLADGLHLLFLSGWFAGGIASLSYAECLVLPVVLGFYLYWDFSGYSDIAIGSAALLGFRVPENFDRPYRSASVSDFWRRWHITLSEWIRLRIMMKLTGRRPSEARFHAAVIGSMALCGAWHGAGWNFLAWGVWHGLGLSAVQLFRNAQRTQPWAARLGDALGVRGATAVTFLFVSLGWVLFFYPLGDAATWAARVLTFHGARAVDVVAPALLALALWLAYAGADSVAGWAGRLPGTVRGVAWTLLLAMVTYMLCLSGSSGGDFVYASF